MNTAENGLEINKRLTLNWLIQGAAQHAGMTAHHLIRDELDAIHPDLLWLYDLHALVNLLQYWSPAAVLLLGWPPRFWKRAASNPRHPFFHHPLLSQHGGMLSEAAKERAVERSREKGVIASRAAPMLARTRMIEASHSRELTELAKKTTSMVWGISTDRLNADMTMNLPADLSCRAETLRGRILRGLAVGCERVVRRNGKLEVVARGTNWYILAKELVKGTAELICLHGLADMREDAYRQVIHHADKIEFEPWMLQTGGELWRRVLAVFPEGRPLPEMLMHLARMEAAALERAMLAVIEQPEVARELLAGLGLSNGSH